MSWAADARCASGAVAFGDSAAALTRVAAATRTTYSAPAATGSADTYYSPSLFSAALDGLVIGAPVFYSVGSNDSSCGGLWSPTFSTATAPDVGAWGARFAVIGDLGTTNYSNSTLANIVARSSSAPFAATLLVGDLSYADGTQATWDTFGALLQPLASTIPLQFIPGNHEWFDTSDPVTGRNDFRAYMARTHTPLSGAAGDASSLYYSFESGLVHFVMLQGYCPEMTNYFTQPCLRSGGAQIQWLESDLAGVNREITPWVVVTFHQPYANSNTAHSYDTEGVPMQQALEDLLYSNGVDLVFSGHVHAYERSCRMYQFNCVADGVTYITIGDGGNHVSRGARMGSNAPRQQASPLTQINPALNLTARRRGLRPSGARSRTGAASARQTTVTAS